MDDIKVGDVVYLKSEPSVKLTVAYISDGEAKCLYYRTQEGIFQTISNVPLATLGKFC